MKTARVLAALLLAAVTTAGTARARTVGGATFPDSVTAGGKTLVLNGIGKRVFALVVDGYASALYLEKPAQTADAVIDESGPKLLATQFLHAASASQIRDEYSSVFQGYCGSHSCSDASRATFNKVLATVQPVKVGDTETYLIDNGTLTLGMNGRTILTVHDPDYTHGMLDSLLGAASPTAAYRRGLLGDH